MRCAMHSSRGRRRGATSASPMPSSRARATSPTSCGTRPASCWARARSRSAGRRGDLAERWIHSRLAEAIERATRQLDALDLGGYTASLHEFAWSEFADWFLEMAKVELRRPAHRTAAAPGREATASEVLADLLESPHPIMPFVTEEIWDRIGSIDPATTAGEPLLITAPWPPAKPREPAVEEETAGLMELVRAVRNLRPSPGRPPGRGCHSPSLRPIPMRRSPRSSAQSWYLRVRSLASARSRSRRGTRPAAVASSLGAAWFPCGAGGDDPGARAGSARGGCGAGSSGCAPCSPTHPSPQKGLPDVVARERERLSELEERMRKLGPG